MLALPNILSTVDALIAETDDLLNYSAYTLSNNTTPSYGSFSSYSTPIFSSYSTPIFSSQNIISNDYYPFEQDDSGVSMAMNSAWNTLNQANELSGICDSLLPVETNQMAYLQGSITFNSYGANGIGIGF